MKLSIFAASVLLTLAACTHQAPPASTTTTTSCSCPMHAAGTPATEVDVEGGAAIELKTTGDVAALRAHAHKMAEMSEHCACPMMATMQSVPSTATVEDTEGGARITYKPKDPAQLDALRANVRMHAQHMQSGCPMMSR
jgi:hypothetical protein